MRLSTLNALASSVVASAMVLACGTLAQISDGPAEDSTGPLSPPVPGPTPIGGRTDDNITILPAMMDFSAVACGTESLEAKVVTITNSSTAAVPYEVVVPDGASFRVDGTLKGQVVANNPVHLKVFATPGRAGAIPAQDLVITAGKALQPIKVTTSGTGATFDLLPSTFDFGDVRMQSGGGPVDIEVTNNGTEAAVVSAFDKTADFSVAFDTMPLRIEPKAKALIHATFAGAATPSGAAPLQAMLKPVLNQKLCGVPPVLTLKGRRVNSNVTLSSGDFGTVNCDKMNAKDIVISNYSAFALGYTATLAPTSAFTISGATGTITPGTATTPVTAKVAVQPKPYGTTLTVAPEDLTITISGIATPEGGARTVPLKIDPRGAIVTFTPNPLIGFVSDGTTADVKPFTATNSGNQTIYLFWGINVRMGSRNDWSYSLPSSLGAGQSKDTNVSFKPAANGASESDLIPFRTTDWLGRGAVSCTSLPSLGLKGTRP